MNFVFPHPLDTPRLRLRTFREEDAAPLFAMMSDPEVMRYWNTPPWTTLRRPARRSCGTARRSSTANT